MLRDVLVALRFYTRLPVPPLAGESDPYAAPDFGRVAYAIPLAGAVVGAIGALALANGFALRFPPLVCAALALTAMVLATGCFHEDGLADSADGLGGGRDREQRLVIMRDSRIGTYGGVALILSLLLRASAIAALAERTGMLRTALVLIAAAAASRAGPILLMRLLPPAQSDGSSYAIGQPSAEQAAAAVLIAALIVAVLLVPSFGVNATFAALIAPLLALAVMARQAKRLIGGQTGDVAGATQQVAEIAILLGVLIFAR